MVKSDFVSPNAPAPGLHPAIAPPDPFEGSGKEVGQIKAPIVSVNPSSKNLEPDTPIKKEFVIVDNAIDSMFDEPLKLEYPFDELKQGQGLFIEVEENQTTDKLMEKMYKTVFNLNTKYAEVEHDENGDEILDVLTVRTRKRNSDGTLQLNNGEVITGANSVQKPKLASYRHFVIKPIVKEDEIGNKTASNDGVIIIRTI